MQAPEHRPVVRTVVAPVFGTNCYVVSVGTDCVVVDAGGGAAPAIDRLIADAGLHPRAVLATHGHADHTWDAGVVCGRYDVPFVVHAADEYRVRDPLGSLDAHAAPVTTAMAAALNAAGLDPDGYRPPARIDSLDIAGTAEVTFGDVRLRAVHAPGHTEGSTLYLVGASPDGDALTGDVLFAGAIGRTDLPGGEWSAMASTLAGIVSQLDPGWRVRPGHGPASTMARELATNPFLTGR